MCSNRISFLNKAFRLKVNDPLRPWIPEIVKHYWHCLKKSSTAHDFIVSLIIMQSSRFDSIRNIPMSINLILIEVFGEIVLCDQNIFSQDRWRGVLYHITGCHQWLLPTIPGGVTACEHGPLEPLPADGSKQYIDPCSPLLNTLRDQILDKKFLAKVPYYLNVK